MHKTPTYNMFHITHRSSILYHSSLFKSSSPRCPPGIHALDDIMLKEVMVWWHTDTDSDNSKHHCDIYITIRDELHRDVSLIYLNFLWQIYWHDNKSVRNLGGFRQSIGSAFPHCKKALNRWQVDNKVCQRCHKLPTLNEALNTNKLGWIPYNTVI